MQATVRRRNRLIVHSVKNMVMLGPVSLVTSVPIASNPNPHLCASSLVFRCAFSLVLLVLPLVC